MAQRVAVVTGAGSGIGRAITLGLAARGSHVVAADKNLDAARETAQAEEAVTPSAVDIADAESVAELERRVRTDLGPATVLVNAAGWDETAKFLDASRDFAEKVVTINYLGPVEMCRVFLPQMVEAGSGKVVNIASDAGRVGSAGETIYAGAKGGVIALTKSLAREMARYQINVNCVCPGPTDTPLFGAQPEKLKEALVKAIPFRRLAKPEEIAAAVLFFASEEASFVTGQVLSVSGGLTMAG